MSILNTRELDWNIHNEVLMRTLEGQQEALKDEFMKFLIPFRGLPINEYTLNQLYWTFEKFKEHVMSKYAFSARLMNIRLKQHGITPTITGDFEYATPMSLNYKALHFSIS